MKAERPVSYLVDYPKPREKVGLDQKIEESSQLLLDNFAPGDLKLADDLTKDNYRVGIIPRLSPYDIPRLEGTKLVEIPKEMVEELKKERSYDLIRWNKPDRFLFKLKLAKEGFKKPVKGKSKVMKRLAKEGKNVAFDNLGVVAPTPKEERQSRTDIDTHIEVNIMGQARIPLALGSVPDVGSHLAYVTMAQAGGMVFMSRDKLLSDIGEQAQLAEDVINTLTKMPLPKELKPNEEQLKEFAEIKGLIAKNKKYLTKLYYKELRQSWVNNVGAAIEAEPGRALARVTALYEKGVRLFRIYSPEGGMEIIETIKKIREKYNGTHDLKIVAGQIMDLQTGLKAQKAGADALFLGVAGGKQCTTAIDADLAINTATLLHKMRGKIKIPIGIEGGGVGTHLITAFALGASFLSKPGEIGVSWEGAGGKYIFEDEEGKYYMSYGGEASVSAKWWKDSMDDIGRPKFVEGETGVQRVRKRKERYTLRNISMTGNIKRLRDATSNGLVFRREPSIAELHNKPCNYIREVTEASNAQRTAYGNTLS